MRRSASSGSRPEDDALRGDAQGALVLRLATKKGQS